MYSMVRPCACRITNQVLGRIAEGRRFAQLLGDPGVCRRACDTHMHDPPRAEFGDDEGEQRPKEDIGHLQEVAGPDLVGVIAAKGCPGLALGSWWSRLPHRALNRPFRDLDANF